MILLQIHNLVRHFSIFDVEQAAMADVEMAGVPVELVNKLTFFDQLHGSVVCFMRAFVEMAADRFGDAEFSIEFPQAFIASIFPTEFIAVRCSKQGNFLRTNSCSIFLPQYRFYDSTGDDTLVRALAEIRHINCFASFKSSGNMANNDSFLWLSNQFFQVIRIGVAQNSPQLAGIL